VGSQVGASVRVRGLRLAAGYGLSYKAELAGGGLRLLCAAALVAAGLLRAWLGVLASALAAAATALVARLGPETRPAEDLRPYQRQVLRYLLPSLPSALYFSVQGPVTVWLAATFGSTGNLAAAGAL